MNLYLLTQNTNHDAYYTSCVVIAADPEAARQIRPGFYTWEDRYTGDWAYKITDVQVELIGRALPDAVEGVICESIIGEGG